MSLLPLRSNVGISNIKHETSRGSAYDWELASYADSPRTERNEHHERPSWLAELAASCAGWRSSAAQLHFDDKFLIKTENWKKVFKLTATTLGFLSHPPTAATDPQVLDREKSKLLVQMEQKAKGGKEGTHSEFGESTFISHHEEIASAAFLCSGEQRDDLCKGRLNHLSCLRVSSRRRFGFVNFNFITSQSSSNLYNYDALNTLWFILFFL